MNKILVLAPHPDDEVLGCGGTIKKYSNKGKEVYLCVITKAYTPDWSEEFLKQRPKEIEEANKILGIKKTYFLNFPTAKLDTIPQKELNDSILKIINEIKPQILYLPHGGDINRDHRLVFEATLVAVRPNPNHSVEKLLSYETLSGNRGYGEFIPNVYEDVTEEIKIKIEAMKAYKSEIKEYPHPRSPEIIEALAKKRGSEAGFNFAEAFMLIKEISP